MKQGDLFGGPAPPKETGSAGVVPAKSVVAKPDVVPVVAAPVVAAPVVAAPVVAAPVAPQAPQPVPQWRREAPKEPRPLSVSEFTRQLKEALEIPFSRVLVRGEISGFRGPNVRGHLYFSLKDDEATLDVKVWQSTAQRLKFPIKDGLSVVIEGSINLYEASGRYSVIVSRIEPVGVGAAALAYEQLKAKLIAEGLLGPGRKKPKRALPLLPRRVGVVTSLSGAALRDFLKVLHRRHPQLPVLIADARVQGEGAAWEIARALKRLGQQNVDVVVLTRGGGSAEDLSCFNEEIVARAIYDCPVPVVSAVGHEIDTTLSDHMADLRAPTPSAAAELVAPVLVELELKLKTLSAQARRAIERRLRESRAELKALNLSFPDPGHRLTEEKLRLSEASEQLVGALRRLLQQQRGSLADLAQRVSEQRPAARLQDTRVKLQALRSRLATMGAAQVRGERAGFEKLRRRLDRQLPSAKALRQDFDQLSPRLLGAMQRQLKERRAGLQASVGQLEAMSPLKVLSRGYAIATRAEDGGVIRRAADVVEGTEVKVRLDADEHFKARVTKVGI